MQSSMAKGPVSCRCSAPQTLGARSPCSRWGRGAWSWGVWVKGLVMRVVVGLVVGLLEGSMEVLMIGSVWGMCVTQNPWPSRQQLELQELEAKGAVSCRCSAPVALRDWDPCSRWVDGGVGGLGWW